MIENSKWRVPYVYLTKQFKEQERFIEKIREVVSRGDYTLGREVQELEQAMASKLGVSQAIGVGNGTDALYLTLKALGIKEGDEVITAPNSFIASAGAIALTGARPVFADVRDDYTIDPAAIEKVITSRTKVIIPVHLCGHPADMYPFLEIARRRVLYVVEDAAQAIGTKYDDRYAGSFGNAGCFSFHPQKILNVWGDGGMIITNDEELAQKIRLWRNHGLKNRNEAAFFAHNSRLDTIQAAIAHLLLGELEQIIAAREKYVALYDRLLVPLEPLVQIPNRALARVPVRPIYTTYVIQAERRDELIDFLKGKGIEALIHYPVPLHLQPAARYLGYQPGDFPVCERQAARIVTLPIHQYLTEADIHYVCDSIREFYGVK